MYSWKWYIRKFNRLYYFLMFRLADFLFVGDKCPECGCYLRHNYTGFGMCEEFYCPKCIETSMKLRTYTISDLRRIDGSYINRIADDWSKIKERELGK